MTRPNSFASLVFITVCSSAAMPVFALPEDRQQPINVQSDSAEKIKEKVPVYASHLHESHGEKWPKVLTNTHALLQKLGENPLLTAETLKDIKAKCLISVGDRDALVSIEESVATYKLIPNASLAIYPNTGHPFEKAPHHKIKKDFLELLH